jgi:EF hand
MKPTNKLAPVVALAVLMGLSGAMIATAQGLEAPATTATADDATVTPVRARQRDGEHGPRGERGEHGREMFRAIFTEADTNADGSVSAEELAALRAAKVAAADANADGALTLQEFEVLWLEAMQPRLVDAFQHVDADGDASITPAEVDAMVANLIDKMDRNGDGVINAEDRGRGNRRGHNEEGQ